MYTLSFAFTTFFYKLRKFFSIFIFTRSYWKISVLVAFAFFFIMSIASSINAASATNGGCDIGALPFGFDYATVTVQGYNPQTRNSYCPTYDNSFRENVGKVGSVSNSAGVTTTTTSGSVTDDYYINNYFRYGGAIGAVMYGAGSLYDLRPATTYDSVIYQAQKAGVVSAQVQGFNQFAPITKLWGVFRDISLLLFVVVFVAIGFFILIQRKIGGQETVSLLSGVANAAVAMIVITFSYAIAGVIVDIFSNVMNGVVATTFQGFINSQEVLAKLYNVNSNVNVLTLMSELSGIGVSQSAQNLFQSALTGISYPLESVKGVFNGLGDIKLGFLPVGTAVGMFASVFVDLLSGIITQFFNNSSLINAIVAFTIFIISLRVVFALIGAYVAIVFKIMFSPFILLPAALPGNAGKTIMGWVLSLIANALTFPAIFACLLMAAMFLNLNANLTAADSAGCNYVSTLNPGRESKIQGNTIPSKVFVVTRFGNDGTADGVTKEQIGCYPLVLPPKFNYWPAPLGYIQGVEPDDLIRFVIALSFIVMTPSVPKILQQLLKVPQDSLLAGVSQGFKSGAGAFSSFISAVPSFGVGRAIGSVTRSAADSAG